MGPGPGLVNLLPLFQETGFKSPIPCFLWFVTGVGVIFPNPQPVGLRRIFHWLPDVSLFLFRKSLINFLFYKRHCIDFKVPTFSAINKLITITLVFRIRIDKGFRALILTLWTYEQKRWKPMKKMKIIFSEIGLIRQRSHNPFIFNTSKSGAKNSHTAQRIYSLSLW